jgi:UDPglucose 6-dehydrogenase
MAEVSIIGLGFVGGAMYKSYTEKGINVYGYDKYKDGGTGNIETCLNSKIVFLCLPTLYNEELCSYDKSSLNEVLTYFNSKTYNGVMVIKSTVEPQTTKTLSEKYNSLSIVHNPEFLTARTAYHDFHNQKHIVLGKGLYVPQKDVETLEKFYKTHYPDAEITHCSSDESECMKTFVNSFYASKIQLFNEFYLTCKHIGVDYNNVKHLMLKNKWINPRHTNVPGPDGKLSYGGACFPKDTKALLSMMKKNNTPCNVLEGVVAGRDEMRKD